MIKFTLAATLYFNSLFNPLAAVENDYKENVLYLDEYQMNAYTITSANNGHYFGKTYDGTGIYFTDNEVYGIIDTISVNDIVIATYDAADGELITVEKFNKKGYK